MPGVTFTTGGALNKSALRQANERLALNAIRQNPLLSRSDLARVTGLSPSSVTFIIKRLKRERLVCEEKTDGHAQVGRQPIALRLRADAKLAVGVEITLSGGRLALAPGQALGVGVALPGFIERSTGKVLAAENLNWFGIEAGRVLRRDLTLPFYFENGAKLAALSELWLSERDPAPLRHFVAIQPRCGLGTGVIVNGQILQGATSGASEFGHIVLYPDGRRCQCGNTGCWEQYASDFALCRRYAEQSGLPEEASAKIEAEGVVGEARQENAIAHRVLMETAADVGLGFVSLIMAFNPEAILVGDYLAEAWDMIEEAVLSLGLIGNASAARYPGRRRERRAEAFSISRLEGSRWRLRRMRQLCGLKAALVPPGPGLIPSTIAEIT